MVYDSKLFVDKLGAFCKFEACFLNLPRILLPGRVVLLVFLDGSPVGIPLGDPVGMPWVFLVVVVIR